MITDSNYIDLRPPRSEDGSKLYHLVAGCQPLDMNSRYCNLLQCTHFSGTSVAAEKENVLVGFISAHFIPERSDTLFIWQVAVDKDCRGQGLATQMLKHILDRPQCAQVRWLETTVTESNQASWALFDRLAVELSTELERIVMFDRQKHFEGEHDTELLARIGPIHF